jgi:RimJ/RimL family protein N-acetyltransferase
MDASDTDHAFEIHVAEDGRYIGNVGLHKVDMRHRHAEIGIFIGSSDERGKGYGFDAIVTCLRFAFDTLGLNSVFLGAFAPNQGPIDLYRKIGFTEGGRVREYLFAHGEFHDCVLMDITASDFRERYGASDPG